MDKLDKFDIIGITILSIVLFCIIFGIVYYNVPWYKLKNYFSKGDKNGLKFYQQETISDSYSTDEILVSTKIRKIISNFKNSHKTDIVISSNFNNIRYAIFDLDSFDNKELFKKIYSDVPYVIFLSSSDNSDHFWGILDVPYKKYSEIFNDTNWNVCNDNKYVSFCKAHGFMMIRGLYQNKKRKPHIYETNGNFSENFQLFIDNVTTYYDRESLELSVLKYQNDEMLIKYNRVKKLQELKKCQS